MPFDSLDDALFWHGSLIGYMAGVKSACKDEDKSSLLLRMADTQARLEFMESKNAKLRTALSAVLQCNGITKRNKGCDACPMYDKEKEYVWAGDWCGIRQFIRELGIEVE